MSFTCGDVLPNWDQLLNLFVSLSIEFERLLSFQPAIVNSFKQVLQVSLYVNIRICLKQFHNIFQPNFWDPEFFPSSTHLLNYCYCTHNKRSLSHHKCSEQCGTWQLRNSVRFLKVALLEQLQRKVSFHKVEIDEIIQNNLLKKIFSSFQRRPFVMMILNIKTSLMVMMTRPTSGPVAAGLWQRRILCFHRGH